MHLINLSPFFFLYILHNSLFTKPNFSLLHTSIESGYIQDILLGKEPHQVKSVCTGLNRWLPRLLAHKLLWSAYKNYLHPFCIFSLWLPMLHTLSAAQQCPPASQAAQDTLCPVVCPQCAT